MAAAPQGYDGEAAVVSSTSNPQVKRLVKLREQARFRREEGSALLAGSAPVRELCGLGGKAQGALRTLLLLEQSPNEEDWHQEYLSYFAPDVEVVVLGEAAFKKATGIESAETKQAAAELFLPMPIAPSDATFQKARRVLVLDRVQDPGNVGTLLRTAVGLGWDAAVLVQGCDAFNDKALRASRGAPWRVPVSAGTWEDIRALAEGGTGLLVADMGGASPETIETNSGGGRGMMLVLSSEGAGVSRDADGLLKEGLAQSVGVPLKDDCESLNVGVAGGILMYALGGGV